MGKKKNNETLYCLAVPDICCVEGISFGTLLDLEFVLDELNIEYRTYVSLCTKKHKA